MIGFFTMISAATFGLVACRAVLIRRVDKTALISGTGMAAITWTSYMNDKQDERMRRWDDF